MGTRFEIVAYSDAPTAEGRARSVDPGFLRIAELDARLSDYRPDSEICRLAAGSATCPGDWTAASADLIAVLVAAAEVSERSGGAFDVTVGPLTRIWRRVFRQHELRPAWRDELLRLHAETVDWRAIEVERDTSRVRFSHAGMQLDLGGIAKGYALDEALRALAAAGIEAALVDGGGDVAVMGLPPGRDHWVITIEDPFGDRAHSAVRLRIEKGAVCTSGDLYRYTELDGIRYSHLIDPRSGMALTDRVHATVYAQTGILADALASAVSVLGPVRGRELAESWPGVEARIVSLDGEVRRTTETSGFGALLIH